MWLTDCVPSMSELFKEVALQTVPGTSIDELASYLLRWDLVTSRKDQAERLVARSIAFAILGWQTLLFQPALGTCPLQQMAVADVMDGYNGQAFMKFKQDHCTIKRPLSDFLLGFGLMLPKENTCISEDAEDCQAYEKVDIVRPEEINVSLLHRFARIDIEWVDVMAPHLEFDKATNKLFLFRHPSFCMANLLLLEESGIRSMIYKSVISNPEYLIGRLILVVVLPKTTTIRNGQLRLKSRSFFMKYSFLTACYLDRTRSLGGLSKTWRATQTTRYSNNYALTRTTSFQSCLKSGTFIA